MMCGRYTLSHSAEEVAERFRVQEVLFSPAPCYNIAPSQTVAVVAQNGARRLDSRKWGLVPSWAKDPQIGHRMINARAETLAQKPSFKRALARRRCLIPADSFYEWQGRGRERQPLRIHARSGELFAFAGLWEEWRPAAEASAEGTPDGAPLRTCTIITTSPNDLMAGIHDRMPAILRREDEDFWLDPAIEDAPDLLNLLRPYPDEELAAHPVSRQVNSPAFDAPQCVQSLADDDGAV